MKKINILIIVGIFILGLLFYKILFINKDNDNLLADISSIKGDVNGDGKVSAIDYILIRKHLLKIELLTGDNLLRADVNNDSKVSALDYIVIRKNIMNNISTCGVSKIHFINTAPESSDAIVIESCGHFGLVDSANPYNDGTAYSVSRYNRSVEHVIDY